MKRMMICGLAAGFGLTMTSAALAGPLDYYYLHMQEKSRSLRAETSTTTTRYFPQLIDHANPLLGTFEQRYYVDDTYSAGDNSPVFLYICGESTCYASALNGEIRTMAKKYHAKMVALEHRYYGRSLPVKTFAAEDMRYLSTDYALKDLARFQKFMTATNNWKGKWISFGGSYPGSLSAYYRLKYPELVTGSLASSAPVRAKENFEEYDAHVTQVAGTECAENMRITYRQIEDVLDKPEQLAQIKRAFQVEDLRDNTDFLFLVADIGSAAVQYGYKSTFCRMLADAETPLKGYEQFASYLYSAWGIADPISLSTQGAESENPADYADGIGMRQWMYQSCREYGYWQTANHDPAQSTRSALIDEDYYHNVCKRLFNLDQKADTDFMNSTFYKPLMSPTASNIFFTNGSTDPWSRLSMTPANGNNTNPKLDYYVIKGAAHCDDLRAPRAGDSGELKTARVKLSQHITDWLTGQG